jgi:uncharacterized SAM-binding protein YcdF (DUF218 family)
VKFLLKQIVGAFATPLLLALVLALAAALCWRWRRRVALGLAIGAVAVAYLGALPAVGTALLAPLEQPYSKLPDDLDASEVQAIVVLGSTYAPAADLPVTAALDEDGLARVVEGVRLARRFPNARLIVSGGAAPGEGRPAQGYAILARELGVAPDRITVLDRSLDTGDEALAVSQTLGARSFVLVTSPYHMRRAMKLMQRAGAHAIAAPAGSYGDGRHSRGSVIGGLVPSSTGLRRTERALHEYLGLMAIAANLD